MLDATHIKRFEKYITRGPDACWHWTGCTGDFKFRHIKGRANRLAFSYYCSPLEDFEYLHRLCDSEDCINPLHQQIMHEDSSQVYMVSASPSWGRWAWNDTHCRNRHVFNYANTNYDADGRRVCRTCGRKAT